MASLRSIKELLERDGVRVVSVSRLQKMTPREIEDLTERIFDMTMEIDRIISCARKQPYPTAAAAERGRLAMEERYKLPYDVYRCRYEEHWHVGGRRIDA